MFEKEIKFIVDFSLNKLKKLGSSFTYESILSTDIHPAIVQYISAELDYLIFEDRKKLLQQSVFDYSGPEIAKHLDAISQVIKKNKRISYEDIKKLVIQAVSFNINFTVRPKWSLLKLIFDGVDSKVSDEIKLVLNSIYYYDYIKSVIINYINKKNIQTLNSTEFEMLINKLDKELFVTKTEQLVDNMLYSIADFYNVGEVSKNKVPPSGVELFLIEKNLMDYLLRLRKALPEQAKQSYEIDDIRKILYTPVPLDKQVILPSISEEEEAIEEKVIEEKNNNNSTEPEQKKEIDTGKKEESDAENSFSGEVENALNISDEIDNSETVDKIPEEKEEELTDEIDDISSPEVDVYKNELNPEKEEIKAPNEISEDSFDIADEEEKDLFYQLEQELNEPNIFIEPQEEDISNMDDLYIEEEVEKEKSDEDVEEFDTNMGLDSSEETPFQNPPLAETQKEKEPEKLSGHEFTGEEEVKPVPGKKFNRDIFNFLSDKEIGRIVSSVFNEDREDFANTMEKLMECESYDESTEILKSVFLTYRINPYSKDAVTLTNAVSNYFDQA